MLSSKLSTLLLFFITFCAAAGGIAGPGGRVQTEEGTINTSNGDPAAPTGPNHRPPTSHEPTKPVTRRPKATGHPREHKSRPHKPQQPKPEGTRFTQPEIAKTTNAGPRKPQATGVPQDLVVPCRAPYGNNNGCSYCDTKYGMKPSPMDQTSIKPFNNNQFASSEGMKGYTIW